MKKALKIGAVAMVIHLALNIGFMMGHAAPPPHTSTNATVID